MEVLLRDFIFKDKYMICIMEKKTRSIGLSNHDFIRVVFKSRKKIEHTNDYNTHYMGYCDNDKFLF